MPLFATTLVVRDYDEAIAWFTAVLGFSLVEDAPRPGNKRWVLVRPPYGGSALLLARAATPAQEAEIGRQAGGRVAFFLTTDSFARDHAAYLARGVRFEEAPRHEDYGTVAVFADLYGNRWDLIEHHAARIAQAEFDLAEATAVLERGPGVWRALLAGLHEGWITTNEGGATWTPYDIVGHLIHGEHTDWLVRARHILAHGDAVPFLPFDREAMFAESRGKTLAELLATFEELRRENLAALRALALTDADLARGGLHPALGPVTLAQLLATWTVHDLGHLAQVSRVMAKRYRGAVGPWRAYLPVLDRG